MASQTAKARYPKQIVLMVSNEVEAVINVAAREQGLSKAEVCRAFLHAGIKAAGYNDVKTSDAPDDVPAGAA